MGGGCISTIGQLQKRSLLAHFICPGCSPRAPPPLLGPHLVEEHRGGCGHRQPHAAEGRGRGITMPI
eukprot:7394229-Alexandrium_andersonii.AAC.1